MSRTSEGQREIRRRVELNKLLSADAEAAFMRGEGEGLGGLYAQPIVDKMYLDEAGVSLRIKALVSEGLISDRKGVYLQYNQAGTQVTRVSLYPIDTHFPVVYMKIGA